MRNFRDIASLHNVLTSIFNAGEGPAGQQLLQSALQESLEFTPQQAALYAKTVLTKNVNGSADWVRDNALNVLGKWVHMDQHSGSGYINTTTTTWSFRDNLTYELKTERYESALNIGVYNTFSATINPQPTIEEGIWAPCDQPEQTIHLVIISLAGYARTLELSWPGAVTFGNSSCTINKTPYAKRY